MLIGGCKTTMYESTQADNALWKSFQVPEGVPEYQTEQKEEPELSEQEKESIQRFGHKYGLAKPKKRTLTSLLQDEQQAFDTAERLIENRMNLTGYKTYCTIFINKLGDIDIVMTSGSFKDSISDETSDNYIGAAVACVGKATSTYVGKATPDINLGTKRLIIKIGGKSYEITITNCRKAVELWNNARGVIEYLKVSDYIFNHLREIEK